MGECALGVGRDAEGRIRDFGIGILELGFFKRKKVKEF